jgi:UDP-galactopyranose mutase
VRVLIIGAGFAGACAAWLLRERGACVTLLEQDACPGGMLRTLRTPEGVPYEYGPRVVSVFRGTPDILPFLRRFAELEPRDVYQGTRLLPDYPVIPFPVDRVSLARLPCGDAIRREWEAIRAAGRAPDETNLATYLETTLGPTLTRLAFEGFNRKFWGRSLADIPAEWGKLRRLTRIPDVGDYRLPSTAPHFYPRGGFEPIFDKLLGDFDVRCGARTTSVECSRTELAVRTDALELAADLVVSTAPIDEILDHRFGALAWSGYRTEAQVVEDDRDRLGTAPDGTPYAWVYTPWPETPVCRTTDFGVIHHGRASSQPRVILREIQDPSVRMYPVWWEAARLQAYLEAASRMRGFVPLGRLGTYKYLTMDSTLAMAQRFVGALDRYVVASAPERLAILAEVRGGWQN